MVLGREARERVLGADGTGEVGTEDAGDCAGDSVLAPLGREVWGVEGDAGAPSCFLAPALESASDGFFGVSGVATPDSASSLFSFSSFEITRKHTHRKEMIIHQGRLYHLARWHGPSCTSR